MTTDLQVRHGAAAAGVLEETPVALVLEPGIRFNDWRDLGDELANGLDRSLWHLADWAAFGLDKVREDPAWVIYRTIVEAIIAKRALQPLAAVGRKVPVAERMDQLSFYDHEEVASLPSEERQAWLGDALRQGWDRKDLRNELAVARGVDAKPPGLSVRVVDEHYEIVIRSAERRDMDPKEWVLEAIREKRDRETPELEAA